MLSRPLLAVLALAVALASCAGTGRNPHAYAEAKLGDARAVTTTSVDGRFLFLGDGSIWNVDWGDARAAARLNPGDTVTVRRGSNREYPYEITPARGGGGISARLGKKLD